MSRRRRLFLSAFAAATALSGCTTLGGNVKGDFSCPSPDSICAPSATIDDRALALISGEDGDRPIAPAGPYVEPLSEGRGFLTASAPIRTRERVLRIVFPAQIDAAGRLHEQTAVHAVVEQGEWVEALAGSPVPPLNTGAAQANDDGPLLAAVERADPPLIDTLPVETDAPSAEAVARARAQTLGSRTAASDPVGEIKDQVSRTLRAPRRAPPPRRAAKPVATSAAPPTPSRPNPANPASGAAPVPVLSGPALNATPPGTGEGGRATDRIPAPQFGSAEAKAAMTAVATNPGIRTGLEEGEVGARASAQDGTARVLRASPFPGLQP